MKKYLLVIAFCFICFAASAQVGGIHYQSPFQNSNQQDSYQSQTQSLTIRTTAHYYDDFSGRYIKVPIKVAVRHYSGITEYEVVEEFSTTGYGGGQWRSASGAVRSCMSALSDNPLEKQFMYKALVSGKYYYFDL